MSRYILRLQSMSLFVILLPMTYCLYYLRCVVPYRLLLTVYGLFLSEVRYFPLFDPTVYILHIKTFAVTEDRTRESSHDECLWSYHLHLASPSKISSLKTSFLHFAISDLLLFIFVVSIQLIVYKNLTKDQLCRYKSSFFKYGPIPASFLFIFGLFQANINAILKQTYVKICPYRAGIRTHTLQIASLVP